MKKLSRIIMLLTMIFGIIWMPTAAQEATPEATASPEAIITAEATPEATQIAAPPIIAETLTPAPVIIIEQPLPSTSGQIDNTSVYGILLTIISLAAMYFLYGSTPPGSTERAAENIQIATAESITPNDDWIGDVAVKLAPLVAALIEDKRDSE